MVPLKGTCSSWLVELTVTTTKHLRKHKTQNSVFDLPGCIFLDAGLGGSRGVEGGQENSYYVDLKKKGKS